MKSILSKISTFFGNLVLRYGVLGLAIGMFAESLGIPTASVVLELTAGPLILTGKTTFLEAVIFATAGLTLGSVVSYYLGYYGADLSKKILNRGGPQVKRQQTKAQAFLMKYGDVGILFAQLFGPARTWISVPAGALKMDIRKFTIYTAIGGALYCSFAIGLSVALATIFKAFYNELLGYLRSPIIAGAITAGVVTLIVIAVLLIINHYKSNGNGEMDEIKKGKRKE
jgi:membrane protein DedA with SNARE-associated domain